MVTFVPKEDLEIDFDGDVWRQVSDFMEEREYEYLSHAFVHPVTYGFEREPMRRTTREELRAEMENTGVEMVNGMLEAVWYDIFEGQGVVEEGLEVRDLRLMLWEDVQMRDDQWPLLLSIYGAGSIVR